MKNIVKPKKRTRQATVMNSMQIQADDLSHKIIPKVITSSLPLETSEQDMEKKVITFLTESHNIWPGAQCIGQNKWNSIYF